MIYIGIDPSINCTGICVSVDNLNKYYTELYNSLGVEPGLLSKTTIGKNLNKKFYLCANVNFLI